MKLLELLNSKVAYKVARHTDTKYEETATIDGKQIVFQCETSWIDDHNFPSWEIAFMTERGKYEDGKTAFSIKKTGSGRELKIFAFVVEAIHRFVAACKPEAFHFSADNDEPSRVKLYAALARRFKDSDYTQESMQKYGYTSWRFTRK